MKTIRLSICAGLLLSGATACSLAPRYSVPTAPASHAFKEAGSDPSAGMWKVGAPSEDAARGEWWKVFGDERLNELESLAQQANQDLAAAAARVQEARAAEGVAGAARLPNVTAGFGPSRQQNASGSFGVPAGDPRPDAQTVWRAQANISYEVDLFGRVASTVHAAHADTQQSEALFRSVQLTLQADVAQQYFTVRELDSEQAVYRRTVELRTEALAFIRHRKESGEASELELAQAEAELATATSDAMTVTRQRAASEHALAVLLGKAPSEFALEPRPLEGIHVFIPAGLPSSLLERRPDIAAAERAMAAQNARIGVARAAYFPSIVLTGTGGYESSSLGDLFKWSSRSFLLGPLLGTAATLPLFDGGARKSRLADAKARYEERVAAYRQQVLVAFREVEDHLVDVRVLADQTRAQDAAVSASERAAHVSRIRYDDGSVAYLDVIDTERTVLQARLGSVRLQGIQATSTVNLIRALGGGWDRQAAPGVRIATIR